MREEKKATLLGLFGNILLFIGKIIVGLMYNSIAIISDALNSFTDIIASLAVHVSVIMSFKGADKEHQFGHDRAQPIAALIVAIFTGIVGFEVINYSVRRLLEGGSVIVGVAPIVVVVSVLVIKYLLYLYTDRVCRHRCSPAIKAMAIDHRNDVLVSLVVLFGITAAYAGYPSFDSYVAIAIGFYIIKSGFDIGRDNIKYLIGEAPSDDMFSRLEKEAVSVKGVIGINDVRAHYVGTGVEVEVHIYLDRKMDVKSAHDIGKRVQRKLEKMQDISRAVIHIDPFMGKYKKKRKF